MIKLAITGPESSGKTTLARALADQTGGVMVPEYARFGLSPEEHADSSKLTTLARAQLSWLQEAAGNKPELLIADTEFIVYAIWHEDVMGCPMPGWTDLFTAFPFDHFLICAPDIPWEPDPLRSNPNDRDRLMELYLAKLDQLKCAYTIVSGDANTRLQTALDVVDQLKGIK